MTILNSRIANMLYAYCIFALTGCTTLPEKELPVSIPVPVYVPCPVQIPPKPEQCVPKDESRPEWLKCALIEHERLKAYALELEAQLRVCAE